MAPRQLHDLQKPGVNQQAIKNAQNLFQPNAYFAEPATIIQLLGSSLR